MYPYYWAVLAPLSHAKKAKHPLSSPLQKKRSILCHPPCKKSEASSVIPPLVGGNEGGRGERGESGEGLGVKAGLGSDTKSAFETPLSLTHSPLLKNGGDDDESKAVSFPIRWLSLNHPMILNQHQRLFQKK